MSSTSAYVIAPATAEPAPGVLVLHSWFGLNHTIKELCDELADAGFVALAPDLFEGASTTDPEVGEQLLHDVDPDYLVASIVSSADALRRMPATDGGPIGVIGFSMGASLGLWLSERRPDSVAAVVAFYGSQDIDFTESQAAYQLHLAGEDTMVDVDDLTLMEASLHLSGRDVEVHHYDGVGHWFVEEGTPGYDEPAAAEAWSRTVTFLHQRLG